MYFVTDLKLKIHKVKIQKIFEHQIKQNFHIDEDFSGKEGMDFCHNFAPLVKMNTIRIKLHVKKTNVKNILINRELEEETISNNHKVLYNPLRSIFTAG